MNSIDCVRATKCFDVLLTASEEKSKNEAEALDFEIETAKNKNSK